MTAQFAIPPAPSTPEEADARLRQLERQRQYYEANDRLMSDRRERAALDAVEREIRAIRAWIRGRDAA